MLLVAASAPSQTQGGVDILLSKARSLESRGRIDLAVQNWRKVLLVNPNQTEALAGLARSAKENGQNDEERSYLDRLRKINADDPQIVAVEKLRVFTPEERNRLDEAGRLAMQHKPDEAMKIYRRFSATSSRLQASGPSHSMRRKRPAPAARRKRSPNCANFARKIQPRKRIAFGSPRYSPTIRRRGWKDSVCSSRSRTPAW